MESRDAKILRIYIGEDSHYKGKPLYEWLTLKARESGMKGATVLRGIEGYGASTRLHTAKVLRLAGDLPIVIEIVDLEEQIEAFLSDVDGVIDSGMIVIEDVHVRFYRGSLGNTE
jgi:PII-like signaling protein